MNTKQLKSIAWQRGILTETQIMATLREMLNHIGPVYQVPLFNTECDYDKAMWVIPMDAQSLHDFFYGGYSEDKGDNWMRKVLDRAAQRPYSSSLPYCGCEHDCCGCPCSISYGVTHHYGYLIVTSTTGLNY